MNDPQVALQAVHYIWTAVITAGGAIVAFFTKRLVDEVDRKADKSEVDELKQDIKDFLERNATQHTDNTKRLDQILLTLSDRRNRRQEDRGQ